MQRRATNNPSLSVCDVMMRGRSTRPSAALAALLDESPVLSDWMSSSTITRIFSFSFVYSSVIVAVVVAIQLRLRLMLFFSLFSLFQSAVVVVVVVVIISD